MSDDFLPPNVNDFTDTANAHAAINQANALASQNTQAQYQMEEVEKNLAEAQLECEETLSRLRHDLRQDVLVIGNNSAPEWKDNPDSKKRVLTDEGVDKIMEILRRYINKETLLSNFDEKTINRRMLEFCLAFTGLILMKYEIFFRRPSMKECYDLLEERINRKVERKMMVNRILMRSSNQEEIKKDILEGMEKEIEDEIDKIQDEKKKLNLREFEMMFTGLKAIVEATHNRAWKGEERGSLRRHFNISEVIGGNASQAAPKNKIGFWSK